MALMSIVACYSTGRYHVIVLQHMYDVSDWEKKSRSHATWQYWQFHRPADSRLLLLYSSPWVILILTVQTEEVKNPQNSKKKPLPADTQATSERVRRSACISGPRGQWNSDQLRTDSTNGCRWTHGRKGERGGRGEERRVLVSWQRGGRRWRQEKGMREGREGK